MVGFFLVVSRRVVSMLVLLCMIGTGAEAGTTILNTGKRLLSAARSANGRIGMLYRAEDTGSSGYGSIYGSGPLQYVELTKDGAKTIEEEITSSELDIYGFYTLALDDDGVPHMVCYTMYNQTLLHFSRKNGAWSQETVGTASLYENVMYVRIGPKGSVHAINLRSPYDTGTLVITYATNQSGIWNMTTTSFPESAKMRQSGWDFAVDSMGAVHLACGLQEQLDEAVTWPGSLCYFTNAGGAWVEERIATRSTASWDGSFRDPSIAIGPGDRPAIAAHLKYNVLTGSDALSRLVFACRTNTGWGLDILAETADNYFGSDGGHFTGLRPQLAIDTAGTPHITFSDLASSHVGGYEQWEIGQIRHAVRGAAGWSFNTILPQSAANKEGITLQRLFVDAGGQSMAMVANVYPGGILGALTLDIAAPALPSSFASAISIDAVHLPTATGGAFAVGDQLSVRLAVHHAISGTYDVYAGVYLPGGASACFKAPNAFAPVNSATPLIRNWAPGVFGPVEILGASLDGLPSGDYTWFFALVQAGASFADTTAWKYQSMARMTYAATR